MFEITAYFDRLPWWFHNINARQTIDMRYVPNARLVLIALHIYYPHSHTMINVDGKCTDMNYYL